MRTLGSSLNVNKPLIFLPDPTRHITVLRRAVSIFLQMCLWALVPALPHVPSTLPSPLPLRFRTMYLCSFPWLPPPQQDQGIRCPYQVQTRHPAPQGCLSQPGHKSSRVMLTLLSHILITIILHQYFLTYSLFSLPFLHSPFTLTHGFRLSPLIWADTSAPLFYHQIGVFIKQDWSSFDIILTW